MIDEQSSASGRDYASDRSAIGAGCGLFMIKCCVHICKVLAKNLAWCNYTTHNKLGILGLIFVQFIYLIFLVTEIFVTAEMSNYDQNKTLDLKIQHLLDVRNYTRSRTPPN